MKKKTNKKIKMAKKNQCVDKKQAIEKFNTDYNQFNALVKDICEGLEKYVESMKILKSVAKNLLWYGDKNCFPDGQPLKGIKNLKKKMYNLEDVVFDDVDDFLEILRKLNKRILKENGK